MYKCPKANHPVSTLDPDWPEGHNYASRVLWRDDIVKCSNCGHVKSIA